MCEIFDFSDFAENSRKKIRFKFEIWKIVVQKYPVGEAFFEKKIKDFLSKRNHKGILYKMKPDKIKRGLF